MFVRLNQSQVLINLTTSELTFHLKQNKNKPLISSRSDHNINQLAHFQISRITHKFYSLHFQYFFFKKKKKQKKHRSLHVLQACNHTLRLYAIGSGNNPFPHYSIYFIQQTINSNKSKDQINYNITLLISTMSSK